MRSTNRQPPSLWQPKAFFRHNTPRRSNRSAWFFGGLGLCLQGGLDGLAGEFAGGGDGEGLDLGEDLAIGGLVRGPLQLLGQKEGPFHDQGLQGGVRLESVPGHDDSSVRVREPSGYFQLP
jgi:hypothetical protein